MNLFKRYILLILSIFLINMLLAQDIVTLKKQYKNETNLNYKAEYLNKISFHYLNHNLDSAKIYFNELANLNKDLGNYNAELTSYYYLGDIYYDRKDYDRAISYYKEAIEIAKKYKIIGKLISSLTNVALVYQTKGKYRKSNKYALEAIQYVTDDNQLAILYGTLAENYSNIGNNDKSVEYLNLYQETKEKMIDREKNILTKSNELFKNKLNITNKQLVISNFNLKSTEDSLKKVEKEKKEQEAENRRLAQEKKLLEKEKEVETLRAEKAEQEREKIIIVTIVIGIALIITTILLLIILRLLKLRNSMNKELRRLNETKDKFFSIISHDLKSPIRSIKSLTDLFLKKYEKWGDDKKQDILNKISESSTLLYELLESLLNWSRTQRGRINFKPIELNINDIVNKNIDLLKNTANQKSIELKNSINDDIKVLADKEMIDTIYRNLITNAIKFTPEEGCVEITYKIHNDYYIFNVIDSGIGISNEKIPKLFRLDGNFTSKGTSGELGTGLGLILCKEFIEKNNGSIWVQSEVGKGSIFSFSLPKNKKS